MRTTKELLVIMLENINNGRFQYGLCGLVDRLFNYNIIGGEEYNRLMTIIQENRPKSTYDGEWYWKPGIKKPRVNWLNTQIEKL